MRLNYKTIEISHLSVLMDEKFIFESLLNGKLELGETIWIRKVEEKNTFTEYRAVKKYYRSRFDITLIMGFVL